ncbi:MAG: ABC transporter ATP-binding protein [Burkholderiales bacterium]|jgi:putative ABC transport system ATP-binding protein|nr:ABC transporter ATP-binding protein [Burkholderiales bacterium]
MFKLRHLTKTFQAGDIETTALDRIDLDIEAGEYLAITGPSGCGKSTLLGILGLLDAPSGGEYWFDGHNVAGWSEKQLNTLRRGRIGFVFQSFNLIDDLNVAENIALALEYGGLPAKARRERVAEVMERLGIAHRAGHRPSQLSGGQQQRVAIARAIAARPALLLADEPTGNLDSAHGAEVMRLLRELNSEGTTLVMVTHSLEHAAQASRTLRLLDGRVVVDAAAMA